MSQDQQKKRIETKALVVGYAMSRLDKRFLEAFELGSWNAAFRLAGDQLGIPASSVKNLRDEFDPFHDNMRRGWHKRPLRANRHRVLEFTRELEILLRAPAAFLRGMSSTSLSRTMATV